MNFASLLYPVFLVLVLGLHALVRRHAGLRRGLLLAASYAFYAAWDWRFLGLILLSTAADFLAGRRIERARARGARGRPWLLLSIAVNLGLLATFKYLGFFVESFAALAGTLGWSLDLPTAGLLLPVGISFYTFQTLGYTIDVYRGDVAAERSPLTFALFVAWFPQLVAGPIERAGRLLPQLRTYSPVGWARVQRAFFLIVSGLFKKVVLADNIARVVDAVFASASPAPLDVLIAGYAFALQILCDFSGYTDIARGTSKLFGIELMHNFDRPYLARNPRAFWRRWHISLSTWFRDYVYIPLGGRGTGWRGALTVLAVFALAGLWHGAAWTFVAWGLFHGMWLLLWRALRRRREPATGRSAHALAVLLTFHGVCLGWLLFRATSLAQLASLLAASGSSVLDAALWRTFVAVSLVCVAAALLRSRVARRDYVFALPLAARVGVYLLLWFGLVLHGVVGAPAFLYFRF